MPGRRRGRKNSRIADMALAAYDRCRRNEFGGKWAVERAIGEADRVTNPDQSCGACAGARPDIADMLVGVTGDFVPASEVLAPAVHFEPAGSCGVPTENGAPIHSPGACAVSTNVWQL